MNESANSNPVKPPKRNRGWIWYFAAIFVLAVAFVVILTVFNLRQQLTREKLRQAVELWEKNGPRDYDMVFTKQGSVSGKFTVEVRNGKVTSASCDGVALDKSHWKYDDMNALLRDVEDFLDHDSQPGKPRVYAVATFDPHDGHLIHYVRSVMSTRERLEIQVKLKKVE